MKDITEIYRFVHQQTGITKEQLREKNRSKERVFARMLFCKIMREIGCSTPEIGREINQDHTTVLNALKNAETSERISELSVKKRKWSAGITAPEIKELSKGRYSNIFEFYKNKCAACEFDEVLEIHHIIPRRAGGSDTIENLIVLCPNHHSLADKGMLKISDIHIVNRLST